MKLKVCGMRDTQNIKELVKAQPDLIGFIFFPDSKRFVGDSLNKELLNSIESTIKKVAVFVNAEIDQIIRIAELYNFNYLQLHGFETPEFCKQLKQKGFTVIKVFQVSDRLPDNLNDYTDCSDFFLFDTKSDSYGGTGKKFDWSVLQNYHGQIPLFLSGGIDLDSINDIKSINPNVNIYAVDINSRFEIEPGLKDIDKVKEFKKLLSNEL
jgi:phosphoribosylanthranilate isomerase